MTTQTTENQHLFTVVTSTSNPLNKSFDADGNKTSNAQLVTGTYQVYQVVSAREYLEFIKTLTPQQAIILGIPKNGSMSGTICSTNANLLDAIHRTKEDFTFSDSHLLCFDYDPDIDGYQIQSAEHYVEVLRKIDPKLENCEIAVTYGSSYGIQKDGEILNQKISLHAYILVKNSSIESVAKYKDYFLNEATKKGHSHIKISKSGFLLERSVFDLSVMSQERILFEAKPTLAENIKQKKPKDYIVGRGARDLADIDENDGVSKIIFEEMKLEKQDEADKVRAQYIDTQATDLSIKKNISKDKALLITKQRVENQTLISGDILYSKDGVINVSDILANPNLFQDIRVLDPINPKNGEYVAKIFVNDNSIIVHSFKHGGTNFKILKKKETKMVNMNIEQACNILKYLCHEDISFDEYSYKKSAIERLTGTESSPEKTKKLKETLDSLGIVEMQNGKTKIPSNIEKYQYLKYANFNEDCKAFTVDEKTKDEFESEEYKLYQKALNEYKSKYHVSPWQQKIEAMGMKLLGGVNDDNITIYGPMLDNLQELIIDAPEINDKLAFGSYMINYNGTPRIYVATPCQLAHAVRNLGKIEPDADLIFYQCFNGGIPLEKDDECKDISLNSDRGKIFPTIY